MALYRRTEPVGLEEIGDDGQGPIQLEPGLGQGGHLLGKGQDIGVALAAADAWCGGLRFGERSGISPWLRRAPMAAARRRR